jgi:DNA-binding Lrp family transcriptional regulator
MTLAFVLVECARGLASSAEQAIKQLQGVVEAHAIKSGTDYDLIVKVQPEDEGQFKSTISNLKRVVGVAAVAVSVVYGGTLY